VPWIKNHVFFYFLWFIINLLASQRYCFLYKKKALYKIAQNELGLAEKKFHPLFFVYGEKRLGVNLLK
jgi:hypothetical protein